MSLTLKQLRYFAALAEAGSFGTAAARVHVTQPALSLQIKELEERLGVKLVERLPRQLRLTRAGQEVLERTRRILAEVDDLEQAVRWQQGLKGRLNLGVIPTVAPYLLPLALTRIRSHDLTLELRVREAQTDTLLEELRRGRLDAAVVALPVPGPGLVARPIATDRFLLAGSRARLASWAERTEALRPRALAPDQLLLLDEGHCLAEQALEVCGLSGRRQVDLGASSLSTLVGLVAEGFGLTLLPEMSVVTESAAAPNLSLLRFSAPEPARELALVRRESSSDSGWMDDLARLLTEAADALLVQARRIVPEAAAA
ncbi:Transcriptional regulator, OxyR, LysR family protein [Oceanicola granulosus HTCC2516]|uniref:Transcriptional regulator, OxyR, LysR family protein n=1 Tax=Oceanicola granulosus (strain ATCC BAA-861 / DSM 15982 / KCTC 12143 / HTCC2516) TaxID=314256 RepID=Q2CHL9_OCEGH|nr:hydrogen peroxide-inducible genes activator [Oceanicola granulosus]EAR52275.1 Transcriptional regulator, OxyR, LysR family protein [Oceanicola granulosus HTCC2516]